MDSTLEAAELAGDKVYQIKNNYLTLTLTYDYTNPSKS